MTIVDTIRMIVALALGGFALLQLWFMYTAEAVSKYNQWSIAAGLLLIAIGFAFISIDGEEELETKSLPKK
jgi:hypothetical protein